MIQHRRISLDRYKNINNPQGNSPIAPPGATYVSASTLYPDQEDMDHDNTMNELEEYFEYKVQSQTGLYGRQAGILLLIPEHL